DDLRVLETGDQPDDLLLIAPLEPRLEADERPHPSRRVLLPELHHGVGPAASARVLEAHWLHGPEARRVVAAPRQFLDGHAALEELEVLPIVRGMAPGALQGPVEPLVLLLV